jgi:asparagine synthase (glutamine-hydrolysing)
VSVGEPKAFAPLFEPRPATDRITDREEAERTVRDALRDSVEHHLVSDVEVGLFLSGGIDSSVVVALASELAPRALQTFSVVFAEREFDESLPARLVAERFGTTHHEVALSGDDLFATLPAAFAAMDQPSMDGLNTYVVSRAVRDAGLKVVLSGLGGDELFAGYPSFRRAARLAPLWPVLRHARSMARGVARRWGSLRAEKLALLLGEGTAASAAYAASRALFVDRHFSLTAARSPEAPIPEGLSVLQEVSWRELSGYMRHTLLRDSDVFSMAHALELRVPFIDREVAAASASIDDSLKLAAGTAKPLLVGAFRDVLPREVWDRPKRGFTLPFERWMRGPLREEVESALSTDRVARVGLSRTATRSVWAAFLGSRGGVNWSRPWALYTLVRWAEGLDVQVPATGSATRMVGA